MPTFNDTHIESSLATALTVARGAGAPHGFQVDESAPSAATGVKITAAAAGSSVAMSAISSGANEGLTIDAKGSGTVTVAGTSTGNVILGTGSGNVGVGTSSPAHPLHEGRTQTSTTSGELYNTYSHMTLAPTAGGSGYRIAVKSLAEAPASTTQDPGRLYGAWTSAEKRASVISNGVVGIQSHGYTFAGTTAHVVGTWTEAWVTNGASAQSMFGVVVGNFVDTNSQVTSTEGMRGLDVWQSIEAGSTVSHRYGVFVDGDGAAAGDDFGIYVKLNVPNYFAGKVGVGTTSPTAPLDVNGDTLRLRSSKTPLSASAPGNQGDIAWDGSYLYVCVAANTWRRIAHSTW